MKIVLLILFAAVFSYSAVFAVDVWNAVADFNPVPGAQSETAVWTYRQGGTWNSPPVPEGGLWTYQNPVSIGTFNGYGLGGGRNEFIANPTNGWGGCGEDEFAAWTPMVRWLSPINGPIQIDISARQQDAASSRPHIGILLKNGVEITRTAVLLQGAGNNRFISEAVDVIIGDRIDFKIVKTPDAPAPYYSIFKEVISLPPDPNAPKPMFYAYRNTVQAIPGQVFPVKVVFNALEFNFGGTFDLANSKWVPGQVGIGHISAGVSWEGGLWPGQAIEVHIFKNGEYNRAILGAAAGTAGQSARNQINAYVIVDSITDYFELCLYQNQDPGTSRNIDAAWFSGRMIE